PKLPCQSDKTLDDDLIGLLTEQLRMDGMKKPYLGLVHRLDRPVGGLLVLARTKEANRALSKQVSERSLSKEYLVVVCGLPPSTRGELRDYLKKLVTINMSKVVTKNTRNAKEAILDFCLLETKETPEYGIISLLKVNLKTGRHHQIRVQLSNAGYPIWGDNKYNKTFVKKKDWTQISLWAHKLTFRHPISNAQVAFTSFPYDEYPWIVFNSHRNDGL
ncbi:MAG: RNA pseudouridine synthase, partial [Tissierellales bacterium]